MGLALGRILSGWIGSVDRLRERHLVTDGAGLARQLAVSRVGHIARISTFSHTNDPHGNLHATQHATILDRAEPTIDNHNHAMHTDKSKQTTFRARSHGYYTGTLFGSGGPHGSTPSEVSAGASSRRLLTLVTHLRPVGS